MKLFTCQSCSALLFFENSRCDTCGHRLGFLPAEAMLSALEPDGDGWRALAAASQGRYRVCVNAVLDACNWLLPADATDLYCAACTHNRTIPDISGPTLRMLWQKLELAKHRLFYTLLRFGLPLDTRRDRPDGLAFDFLDDLPGQPKVMTGHDDGLITLRVREADDAEREAMRRQMGEPYRTLLGHFRHEVGHYYWDRLVRDGAHLDACRALFGDDRQNYGAALARHYAEGPPPNWRDAYISEYATTHPWEDFAETWAHYLHIVDTLDSAATLGLGLHPVDAAGHPLRALAASLDFDPYDADIDTVIAAWLPLTVAINSLNRSMGQPDLYPFVLSSPVIRKLGFVQRLVRQARREALPLDSVSR